MAYAKSFMEIEIQNLKEELAASQKKVAQYTRLSTARRLICQIELMILSFTVTTLSDELDTLRNNICDSCKKKLVSPSVSVSTPAISGSPSSLTSTASTVLPSPGHRAFQGRRRSRPSADNPLRRGPSNSSAVPQGNYELLPVPCEPGVAHTPGPSSSKLSPGSREETIISRTWSVEYSPEQKRVLALYLKNVVTYKVPVFCVKMSPDGHRLAIGLVDGTTYLNDLKTGSNIWLVLARHVQSFRLT